MGSRATVNVSPCFVFNDISDALRSKVKVTAEHSWNIKATRACVISFQINGTNGRVGDYGVFGL